MTIILFFAVLLSFAIGAASVLADVQVATPGREAYGLILGSAFVLLTMAGVIIGYIIAPIGKILDNRHSKH